MLGTVLYLLHWETAPLKSQEPKFLLFLFEFKIFYLLFTVKVIIFFFYIFILNF